MSHETRRLQPAKGVLAVLLGLTLLGVPACKSQKEEPAATPSQTAEAPAATTTPAPEATAAAASESTAAPMTTKADKGAPASDAEAGDKGVKAQKPPQPGLVWVNLKNGTYHTESSPHYGKTAQGKWMKESKAIAKGYKPVGAPKTTAKDKAASGSERAAKPASGSEHEAKPTGH